MTAQELADRQKELTNGYVQSQSATKKLQKEVEELHQVQVQLEEEKGLRNRRIEGSTGRAAA